MTMKNNPKTISIPMGVTITAILMGVTVATILIVAFTVTASQMISASPIPAKIHAISIEKLETAQITLSNMFQQVEKSELPRTAIFVDSRIPALMEDDDHSAQLSLTVYKEKTRGLTP